MVYLFILTLILIIIASIIFYNKYQNNNNFKILKKQIESIIIDIDKIKNNIVELPLELEEIYKSKVSDLNIKNVNQKTKKDMIHIYDTLFEHQRIVNSIKKSIITINNSKKDIEKYLQDKYNVSDLYLNNEVSKIFDDYKMTDIKTSNYDSKLMFKLIGIEKVLNNKLKFLLNRTVKINNIIVDKENVITTISSLKKSYESYLIKRSEMLITPISNNISYEYFNNYIVEIEKNIIESFNTLKIDLNSALSYYNNYITNISILKGEFKKMNELYDNDQKNRDF